MNHRKYRCSKGHEWEGGGNLFLEGGVSLDLSVGKYECRIDNLCPVCLFELIKRVLKDVGRVEAEEVEEVLIDEGGRYE